MFDDENKPNPNEIVPSKNQIGLQEGFTTLLTEAYAMLSNTYVPDDSHAFTVTLDRKLCWKNFGRCWNDEGEKELVASQKAYKEWLLEFCPPDNYFKCGIQFGINGVCHTLANRELLIGEDDVDVRKAPKNFVTVSIFGKYGYGLNTLKQLITDSYHTASLQVNNPEDVLQTILDRVDNTLDDETEAWKQLMAQYLALPMDSILEQHQDALKKLQEMITNLVEEREKFYADFEQRKVNQVTFEKNIHSLLIASIQDYINFLTTSNYIEEIQKTNALNAVTFFFNKLFRIIDEQEQIVEETDMLDQDLAR